MSRSGSRSGRTARTTRALSSAARCAAASPCGRSAALESARVVRASRPDLDPERLAAVRRRASVIVFLLFAVWGAAGAWIVIGAAGR